MHFCIVAKWFEVPDAQNRFLDRLAVEHSSLPEIDIESEALVQGCLEHLKLNCAHDLHLQFLQPLAPPNVEQGILVGQLPQCGLNSLDIVPIEDDATSECRYKDGFDQRSVSAVRGGACRVPERHTCLGARKSRDRANLACMASGHYFVFLAGIASDLVNLFGFDSCIGRLGNGLLDLERTACHFHPREAGA